jgi:hypothetical protein
VHPPPPFEDLNATGWFRETVENVVGTNVTINVLFHFINGTERTQSDWVDVDTGDTNLTMMMMPLISANLNAGDHVYTGSAYSIYTITETIPMTYPGGSRQTNHIAQIAPDMSVDYYWDRATGVLIKWGFISNKTVPYTTYSSLSVELSGSNQWVVPEFTGLPSTLLLLASLALTTLVYTRKLHKDW